MSCDLRTDVEHTLRRDLRRTKALLQDAQLMLQKNRDGAGSRSTVKQLRNQVPPHSVSVSLYYISHTKNDLEDG